jgi:hypothetical protein
MTEIAFLLLAAYLVWYAIQHLRNEHAAYGGFLNRPYEDSDAIEQDAEYTEYPEYEQPQPQRQPTPGKSISSGSLDDQPAEVIAEAARKAFGSN